MTLIVSLSFTYNVPKLTGHSGKGGYIDMEGFPRLVFENSEDERDIRVNMRLLFEALKGSNSLPVSSTGEMFDCEKANLMKLFDTEDCFICGDSDPVSRVKCQKCNCHFHSYCYAMARVPEADEKVSLPPLLDA